MTHYPKRISFKPVTQEDIPLLFAWFLQPHVHSWWAVPETEHEFADYILKKIAGDNPFAFMVLCEGEPLGYIQYYYLNGDLTADETWLPELPQRTVGIDQIIGDKNMLGKGYGTLFIAEFIQYLTSYAAPDITTVIADPDSRNYGAIRCYEKVGFKSMGVYDAGWGSATLMRYDIHQRYK